ncbi:MAG: phosphoglycerate dehydrogenase [Bdellovibrionales bacterium]
MKILIADALSKQAEEVFRARGVAVDVKTGLTEDELTKIIPAYAGVAVRSAAKITANIIAAAKSLKVIGRAGAGVDTVDVKAATQSGVIVMNTPFGNSITTAEHTVAMMMALARHIPQANASTHAGKWEKSKFTGTELYGKTLGLVGCGNIGSIVADRAVGLKMKVLAYDPFLSPERALELGVEATTLDDIYARSDFISLHTPMLDSTRGMINAETMGKMKKGVRLLNIARGGLIVEDDLKAALDSGQVAGAAIDVYVTEPAKENVLFNDPRVICTPHLGAATAEAQDTCAIQIAEQMCDFLLQGAVTNAVNMPNITAEEAPRLQPYIKLATQLGRMGGQMAVKPHRITVTYRGAAAELNTKPVTAALLAALLGVTHASVNMVNARQVAQQAGLEIIEATQEALSNYQTLLDVQIDNGVSVRLSGTLFSNQPRLVRVDDIAMEAELAGTMLMVRNIDAPGHIGRLGSLLGDNSINIGSFHLGRNQKDGQAVSLVEVDGAVNDNLLKKIAALPNVSEAQVLQF